MTVSISPAKLGSEFDDFLFAPIGQERNGMLLSVLSALARLDVDPWQEASQLAELPKEAATQRLESLIGTLPVAPLTQIGRETATARLIALLPRRAKVISSATSTPSRETSPDVGAAVRSWALIYFVFMLFALGAQLVEANRQPQTNIDNAHALSASTAGTRTQLSNPSQATRKPEPRYEQDGGH